MYRLTKFTMEQDTKSFEGWTDGRTWNGWDCPYFTKEVGLQYAEHANHLDYPAYYVEDMDTFIFNNGEDDPDIFAGVDVDVNGTMMHLYPIGAGYWCWCEEEPVDELDNKLFQVLEELKSLSSDDLKSYMKAYTLLNNLDDAAVLDMSIGKHYCRLTLIHVEVIAMFNNFLEQAMEYYRNETQA